MKKKFRNIVRDGLINLNLTVKNRPLQDRILCFHDIYDSKLFLHKMSWIKDHYTVVPLEQLLDSKSSEPRLAVTCDDGYESWLTVLAPVFDQYNWPCTFFVNSGMITLEATAAQKFILNKVRRKDEHLKPLSYSSLIELASHPNFEIGGHTLDHCDFSSSSKSEYAEIYRQVQVDRTNLMDWTNQEVKYFAYPFGQMNHASREATKAVIKAGYQGACTIIPGSIDAEVERYHISRDSLEFWQSDRTWDRWLRGGYDSISGIKNKILPNT